MTALLAPIWGYLAAAVGGLLTIAGIYVKGRADAANKARTEAMAADIKARDTRDAIDRAVARLPDPSAELRRDWSRPEPVRPVAPDTGRGGGQPNARDGG